jgi:sulfiredoxin
MAQVQQEQTTTSSGIQKQELEGEDDMSIHTRSVAEIHEMPFAAIARGLPLEIDNAKVESIMGTLSDPATRHLVPPIDVMWVQGRDPANNYYFAFGGCHRYEAHRRLGKPTVRAKIVKVTPADVRTYLGSATPDFK